MATGTKKIKAVKKIVWSLDCFEESNEAFDRVNHVLEKLVQDYGINVEAVYVLSPAQLDLPPTISKTWIDKYKPAALKALKAKVQQLPYASSVKPSVVIQPKNSKRAAVQALSAFAKSKGADLIITSSHGRGGLDRMFMGSFAETLLLTSAVPVMVVGPHTGAGHHIQKILYPTDFSKASAAGFDQVLGMAKATGASVRLLHVIPRPAEPVLQSGVYLLGGGWIGVPSLYEQQAEKQQKQAQKWIDKGAASGVDADFEIDKETESVVQSILDHAESGKVDLIAMSAQSGPVAAAVAGSITRQVVRNSKLPVLTVRSK